MVTSVIEFAFATHVVQDYDANPKFIEKKKWTDTKDMEE